jgi:multiple sugar transport system substrate-binding protein
LLYYNRKIFDDAGIPYPPANAADAWTWDEFVAVAKKLTKDTNGVTADQAGFNANSIATYGVWFDTLGWMWPIMAVSNGGGLMSQDGKEFLMDKPESIEAAQAVADLYLKHKVSPQPGAALPTIEVTLLSGQVAMATGGQWNVGTNFPNAPDLDYGVAVLPKFKQAVTYNTGGPECISATTKYPQEAMDFLKWYTQEENNWALIETGVWMPIIEDWYTDEALTRKWVENPNHPPYDEYKSAVVDYAMNNAVQVPWYFHPAYQRIEDVLNTAMGPVWLGAKTAQQAITEAAPEMKRIWAEQ